MSTPTKSARRDLRVARADDALFRQAAAVVGESVSEFLVESGRERAEAILADRTEFTLNRSDWDAFVTALDRPAEVRPAVVDLLHLPRPE